MLDRSAPSGTDIFVSLRVVFGVIIVGVLVGYGAFEIAARTSTW